MISRAIISTLTYSDHFGFPLTLTELHLRLISSEPCSLEKVFETLQFMLKQKHVQQTGEYFHLPGRSTLVARRLRRAQLSLSLYSRARTLATHLGRFPGILAIYLTGSLALSNTSGEADIDFLVITYPNRLWTTRLLLTLYTSSLGLRRTPHSRHSSGKLCLNLYLTPNSYLLPISKQNLYSAYELIQAVPLYDPHNTHADLLAANSWLKQYLPNYVLPTTRVDPSQSKGSTLSFLENLSYTIQRWYMSRKITREYITPNSAFFHPRDPGARVLSKLSLLK